MQISIVPSTSEADARGKAYVHCTAWKEAYRGLLSQAFLDARTLEFSERKEPCLPFVFRQVYLSHFRHRNVSHSVTISEPPPPRA